MAKHEGTIKVKIPGEKDITYKVSAPDDATATTLGSVVQSVYADLLAFYASSPAEVALIGAGKVVTVTIDTETTRDGKPDYECHGQKFHNSTANGIVKLKALLAAAVGHPVVAKCVVP
jgi:hypothetical protein